MRDRSVTFLFLVKQPEHHCSSALHPKCSQAERVAPADSGWTAREGGVVSGTKAAVTPRAANSTKASTGGSLETVTAAGLKDVISYCYFICHLLGLF